MLFVQMEFSSFRYEEEEDKRQDVEAKRQYLLNRSKEKRAKDADMMSKIKYVFLSICDLFFSNENHSSKRKTKPNLREFD